jgi:aerobic-type carbon monoxide dehydrogenase small subunit (CoxS/CutS family)
VKDEMARDVDRLVVALDVNGERAELLIPVHKTLLEVLREDMQLTGTKHGCELGECGTCTVLVDGKPELSCLVLPVQIEGRAITTIEGMANGSDLHPLQQAFVELGAAQCGYCTPGILLAAKSLLESNGAPTRGEIREALAGNLCRCTGYSKILDAVELAAGRILPTVSGEVARRAGGGPEALPTVSGEVARRARGGPGVKDDDAHN